MSLNSVNNTQKFLTVTGTFQVEASAYKTSDLSLNILELDLNIWDYLLFLFTREISGLTFSMVALHPIQFQSVAQGLFP